MSIPYIPTLNLDSYVNGTEQQRKKFSDELGRAFNDSGFVTITNHGLDQELIDQLYQKIQLMFSLPADVKAKYEKPELAGQRVDRKIVQRFGPKLSSELDLSSKRNERSTGR